MRIGRIKGRAIVIIPIMMIIIEKTIIIGKKIGAVTISIIIPNIMTRRIAIKRGIATAKAIIPNTTRISIIIPSAITIPMIDLIICFFLFSSIVFSHV